METQDTTPPGTAPGALSPPTAAWFRARYGQPTPIQRFAWPRLVAGGHLLLSAPTGTGKTLAAFLPVVDALCTSHASRDEPGVACLYIAPLKALCNDTLRTLEEVLGGLRPYFPEEVSFPAVGIRTGDTSAEERRLLREAPPEVLLTTPESLAVLLSQPALRETFAPLRWVIVDEVHALVGEKRGADLALSLERLADLAGGEVQRVGLSATATPLELTARYLAGQDRPCAVARVGESAPLHLRVETLPGDRGFLSRLVERLVPELQGQRSTLIFTNTRGLTERLAWGLRRALPEWDRLIAVHHSALAAPRREEVESDFKAGQLRAVVSSTSLELGIDIGTVDLVVLVHPPGDVIRLLQRVGRSGHAPPSLADASGSEGRRGLLLADTSGELLEAAVTAAAGLAGQCEPLRLCPAPLDVLCQQLAGMACARWWSAEEAFALCRRAAPYGNLSREDFDSCLRYLMGEDREGEPWLPARVRPDGDGFVIRDAGTARLLRRNLGTILGEEAVPVLVEVHRDGEFPDARAIGEVDPAFAERLQAGDRFLLDGRCLEFRRRVEGGLLVEETPGRPRVPRWGGEGWPLSPALARRLYLLRVRAAEALREGPGVLEALLQLEYELDAPAAALLAGYFQSQERISEIPDRSFLLVEAVASEWGVDCYVHTPLNRPANDALARVAVRRLLRDGRSATSQVADLGFALQMRGPIPDPAGLMRRLLRAEGFEADLDEALAESHGLRERFGRVATTGLMLLRNPTGGRRRVGGRDWGGRELFDRVRAREPDFVLLRQALAEVRGSVCDVGCAVDYLRELAGLPIRCRWLRCPSPFVGAWTQWTAGPVEEAESPAEGLARLHALLTGGGP